MKCFSLAMLWGFKIQVATLGLSFEGWSILFTMVHLCIRVFIMCHMYKTSRCFLEGTKCSFFKLRFTWTPQILRLAIHLCSFFLSVSRMNKTKKNYGFLHPYKDWGWPNSSHCAFVFWKLKGQLSEYCQAAAASDGFDYFSTSWTL